jgi:16S rRNA (cytosine1402-N4)-methyltransferase
VGAAGHAAGILRASEPGGTLLGLDADPEAIAFAREKLRPFGGRATLRVANFRHLAAVARAEGLSGVDGILLDLGLSSRQLANGERGFSFSQEGPLDMRMDRSSGRTAASLVNSLPETELADLLWRYGEEPRSRRIARAIVAARPVTSTAQLAAIVARSAGGGKIHPATRSFQALRIAVNDELQALAEVLPQARDLLRAGGRLAVISFHSLEDRLVKQFFQQESRDCICPPEMPVCTCGHHASLAAVNRKPIRPGEGEVERNPPSRSARLRIAERLPGRPPAAC